MNLALFALVLSLAVPVTAQTAAVPPTPTPATTARYSVDTPLELLIDDPKAKAIVLADLGTDPSQHPNYAGFKSMSLSQIAPLSNGAIDSEKLKKIAADLATLP